MRARWTWLCAATAACGVNQTPAPAPGPTLPSCLPDRDGTIDADELPVVLGARLAYYASTDVEVALAGAGPWELSEERAADEVVSLGPDPLADQWYASAFPGAAFVADAGDGLDGVFHQDALGLWLHGTASRTPTPPAGQTLIRYAAPVPVLRFPLSDGAAFGSTAELPDATIAGLPFVGTDRIDVVVAGVGQLDLPYVRFEPALRIRTHVVRAPSIGAPVVERRATSFLFECFGEVARADSRVGEPDPDFTTAATLRRFALGVTP